MPIATMEVLPKPGLSPQGYKQLRYHARERRNNKRQAYSIAASGMRYVAEKSAKDPELEKYLAMNITLEDVEEAVRRASKGRSQRKDVRFLLKYRKECSRIIYDSVTDGTFRNNIRYRRLKKTNNNGKERKILSPLLFTLILQHLCIIKLQPLYDIRDNLNGLNCKKGCGITATDRRRSVVKRLKHLFYDMREYQYLLVIDQRKCYQHVTRKALRRALKHLGCDRELADFALDICFYGKEFPIGTPTSPLAHHILMLEFDLWLHSVSPFTVRYADDNLCAFSCMKEAQEAKWRIKNYWWYMLGIRSKRHTVRIQSMNTPCDFCGYVFHRNKDKGITDKNKGYVRIRSQTASRARRCSQDASWSGFFGQMRYADTFSLCTKIEKNMKLRELTSRVRINRKLDAMEISVRDLSEKGISFSIYDYDMRCDGKGIPNWIKCLIGIPETDPETGSLTGRILAREFHGNLSGIVAFHAACEKEFGGKDALLPMEGMIIENHCGYIYKGSTNMIEYIN